MFHIKYFKNRFRLSVDSLNKIVDFLNNICGGAFIKVERPDTPSAGTPPMISFDAESFGKEYLAAKAPDKTEEIKSGFEQTANAFTKLTDEGKTFGAPGGKGVKCKLAFRGTSNGQEGTIFWRECTITSDGRIYMIGPESDALGILTDS